MPRLERDAAATPEASYRVCVEEVPVGGAAGLAKALLLWAVAHVIFAQRVRRGSRRALYLFIQKYVLHVTDSTLPRVCGRVAEALGVSATE